jgi:hypothetical protein
VLALGLIPSQIVTKVRTRILIAMKVTDVRTSAWLDEFGDSILSRRLPDDDDSRSTSYEDTQTTVCPCTGGFKMAKREIEHLSSFEIGLPLQDSGPHLPIGIWGKRQKKSSEQTVNELTSATCRGQTYGCAPQKEMTRMTPV